MPDNFMHLQKFFYVEIMTSLYLEKVDFGQKLMIVHFL